MTAGGGKQAGPERTAEVRRLEELALNAWPALQTALVEGWLLRFAEGFTKRANSACALGQAGALEDVLPAIQAQYAHRGLPCCLRLTPLAPPDSEAALLARGWRVFDETVIQVAPLVPGEVTPVAGLELAETVSPAWIDGFGVASGRADLKRDTLARMLDGLGSPAVFATLHEGREPVAYGMAVRERGSVGLFDIATSAGHRRQGHAGRLVTGLMAWAAAEGDREAYLQVTASNAPALALYGRLGFAEAYRYAYAVPG